MDSSEQQGLTPLQQAYLLLRQTQAKLAQRERESGEPIAIIGAACRLPGGANDLPSFWNLLAEGRDAIIEVPPERFDVDAFYDPDPTTPGKMYTRWGGFIDNVDQFEPEFFGISEREAPAIDPQQRLLLEVTWQALEHAGCVPASLADTPTGVYVGIIGNDYAHAQCQVLDDLNAFAGTGSAHSIAANRISYVLNLRGPSMALDTACSSSLAAVHLACQSLRRRETNLGLAGGVNLILGPELTVALSKASIMSPEGRCKTFDSSANGYVRSEGCGMVVLKRLSDAQREGDRILAVIRGTAVNHDGRSNGLSAPNGLAQEAVIRQALADAGCEPHEIDYIEAHGTGTRLGDSIEIEALMATLGEHRPPDKRQLVGSVKSNIGHLESAAGIAGLLKLIVMLERGQVPQNLHIQQINPLMATDHCPLDVPLAPRPWPAGSRVRIAGVSSFGFGGTNAHIIVEEPPALQPAPAEVERPVQVLPISGRTRTSVARIAAALSDELEQQPGLDLADVGYTLGARRTHHPHRATVMARSLDEARTKLAGLAEQFAADEPDAAAGPVRAPEVVFLFSGQGSQYPQMAVSLYESQPTFRRHLDECDAILRDYLQRPLIDLLRGESGPALDQTGVTQPALFAVEYALAQLWQSWGVRPAAVMGHSVGEFAAACIAGVYSLEDGLRLIAERARLMQSLPPGGSMMSVMAGPELVREHLQPYEGRLGMAAFNGPHSTVVSGDADALRDLAAALAQHSVKTKKLATSHAFHSHHMEPILDALESAAAATHAQPPQVDVISNLSGEKATAETFADPGYWRRHARHPVQFTRGMETLAAAGYRLFLEIGPQPVLLGMGRRCEVVEQGQWLPSLRRNQDPWDTLLRTLGDLYCAGVSIDWAAFDRDYPRRTVALPAYPFDRKSYWAVPRRDGGALQTTAVAPRDQARNPLLGHRIRTPLAEVLFEARLDPKRLKLLSDHRVYEQIVLPGTAYFDIALSAAALMEDGGSSLEDVHLREPLLFPEGKPRTVQAVVERRGGGEAEFRIYSMEEESSQNEPRYLLLAEGKIRSARTDQDAPPSIDLAAQRNGFPGEGYDDPWRAEALSKSGLTFGPNFTWLTRHWVRDAESLAFVRAAQESDHLDLHSAPPGLIDAGIQLLTGSLPGAGSGIDAHVPAGVDQMRVIGDLAQVHAIRATRTELSSNSATGDIRFYDPQGRLLAELLGLKVARVPRWWLTKRLPADDRRWTYELTWQVAPLETADSSAAEPGRWLIIDDGHGLGAQLVQTLEESGDQYCQLLPGLSSRAEIETAVSDAVSAGGPPCRGIIHLGCLQRPAVPHSENGSPHIPLADATSDSFQRVLDAVYALTQPANRQPLGLWLVTRRGIATSREGERLDLGQSPVWGLGRVIAVEHPELACTRIDLDTTDLNRVDLKNTDAARCARELTAEVLHRSNEDQVAYRQGQRLVARLTEFTAPDSDRLQVPAGQPYALEIKQRGTLGGVELRPIVRSVPPAGQVEIRVEATGLNFRDVLNVLDLYPGDAGPLGGECAGEVVALGDGVEHLAVGDRVMALAPGAFRRFATTLAEFVAPIPADLSYEQAATIPIVFLTAHHALRRLGDIQQGTRVLIHAASGGVGLAAVQIAQQAGAEVFATAGNPEKREYLKSLGVEHVMDSRSLRFCDEILAATDGQGVDLVLNSLTGEAIRAGLEAMADGGRFLEIGKTDLWDQQQVAEINPSVVFHSIALDDMMAHDASDVGDMLQELRRQLERGLLRPIPHKAYPLERTVEALHFMARAKHIGKIVVTAQETNSEAAAPLSSDGTYLVTGGLGGLGLRLAQWMADHGCRHLVLVGRSEPKTEALAVIDSLRQRGIEVRTLSADVSREPDVAHVLAEIAEQMPPVVGLFHLAGVLDDALLRDQSVDRYRKVMGAKVLGAWHLHRLTKDLPLEQFVLFSSAASLVGSPGQGNYASANAFLDALAHHRAAEGLPALSINWGNWSEVGMAAALAASEGDRWAASGIGWIAPEKGFAELGRLLQIEAPQMGVISVDWEKFFARIPAGAEPGWLSEMARAARGELVLDGTPELLDRLEEVAPGERLDVVHAFVQQQCCQVLGKQETDLPDPHRPLNELGFDSLMGVEFCGMLSRAIGQVLNPAILFDYPTLEALSNYIATDLLDLEAAARSEAEPSGEEDASGEGLDEIEQLSEAELDAMIDSELNNLKS